MERLLIGIADAAETLGVGRSTAYALIHTGDLETVKIGRRALITAASVRDYVERLTSTDTRPAADPEADLMPAPPGVLAHPASHGGPTFTRHRGSDPRGAG